MKRLALISSLLISSAFGQNGDRKGHDMKDVIPKEKIPAAPILEVGDALKSISMQDGFKVEAVAHEPFVFNPVTMTFDGDGRMWVCEMNTYMPNVDGTDEEVNKNCISILEDTDGDGKIDKRTVFLDDIVLPRAVTFVKGGILFADHTTLYFVEVLPGLKPGIREVVDPEYAPGGSLEHKPNTMLYALDNWFYNAKDSKAYRALPLNAKLPANSKEIYKNKYFKLVVRKTENRGQWGLGMDDYGRLFHNGNSSPATGEYLRPGSLLKNPGFTTKMGSGKIGGNEVYPARMNPGINRGYIKGMLRMPGGQLSKFTAASGSMVYRGDQFPEKFYGMVLTPEPAGNLISARKVIESEGQLKGQEIYDQKEFLTSQDERFRPVSMFNAPDGSIYFADLYHGVLQHRVFVTTYLRKQILSRDLDKNNNDRGRIYRIRSTAKGLGAQPKLQGLSSNELVPYLAHTNGWWRDKARELIVQQQDKSAVPLVNSLLTKTSDHKVAINALWTLEGLNAVTLSAVKAGLAKSHVKARVNALAVSEFLPEADHKAMAMILADEAKNANYELGLQIAMVAGTIKDPSSLETLKVVLDKFKDKKFINEAAISGLAGREAEFKPMASTLQSKKFSSMLSSVGKNVKVKTNYKKLSKTDRKLFDHGKKLFYGTANCFGCHGPDAEGLPNMGPPLVKSEWVTGSKEKLAKVMLHGLVGPITVNGKKYNTPMPMPGLGANPMFKDKDLAAIATFVRNHFGNKASVVKPEDFAKVRSATKSQAGPYRTVELEKIK